MCQAVVLGGYLAYDDEQLIAVVEPGAATTVQVEQHTPITAPWLAAL